MYWRSSKQVQGRLFVTVYNRSSRGYRGRKATTDQWRRNEIKIAGGKASQKEKGWAGMRFFGGTGDPLPTS